MISQVLHRISTHVCIRVPRISNLWRDGVAQESVVEKSSKDKACIVWHASTNLVPRVLSYPPYGASLSLSLSCSVGRVGENPGNEVARQLVSKLQHVTVPFLGKELTPLSSAKDLGIILDSNLPLSEHISTLAFSLLSNLCQISRVRHLFTKDVLNIILNSLIFSNLFYCSTVWSGTFKQNIKKLPLMQNFVARILSDTRKYDHISPMHELSWITVKELLPLRDTTMIYKCLNGLTPSYLSSKLTEH